MALNTQLTDAAAKIVGDLNNGAGSARASLGGGAAFGWTQGLPRTVANYATTATSEGLSFPIYRIAESGTPATIVAAGAAKPNSATITSGPVTLKKFAAYAQANLEDFLDAAGLAGAIGSVLAASSVKAFEADAVAALDAGAAATPVTATDWVAAVAAAQAEVLGSGGSPEVLVISKADYPGFVADVMATSAFSQSPESAVGAVLGTAIHVSPAAPAGKAFVFDSSGVLCIQHQDSPLALVDSLSQSLNNITRLIVDLVAATVVTNPSVVIEITAPVVAGTAAAKRK